MRGERDEGKVTIEVVLLTDLNIPECCDQSLVKLELEHTFIFTLPWTPCTQALYNLSTHTGADNNLKMLHF